MTEFDYIEQALQVKPGDKVLLTLHDGYDYRPGVLDATLGELRSRFPGVDFTVATGMHVDGIQPWPATFADIYFEPGAYFVTSGAQPIGAWRCLGRDGCGALVLEADRDRHRAHHQAPPVTAAEEA